MIWVKPIETWYRNLSSVNHFTKIWRFLDPLLGNLENKLESNNLRNDERWTWRWWQQKNSNSSSEIYHFILTMILFQLIFLNNRNLELSTNIKLTTRYSKYFHFLREHIIFYHPLTTTCVKHTGSISKWPIIKQVIRTIQSPRNV